jgi:hypothetical protein
MLNLLIYRFASRTSLNWALKLGGIVNSSLIFLPEKKTVEKNKTSATFSTICKRKRAYSSAVRAGDS